jgi:DNA polymerase III gamma/tau subunit
MSDKSTQLTLVTEDDLDKTLATSKLPVEGMQGLRSAFAPHFQAFAKLATAAQAIPDNAPKAARAMRLELRSVRLAAEKTRKDLKEMDLLRTRAVDGVNNLLLYALTPIEKHLDGIEKKEELAEQARINAIRQSRNTELSKYTELPGYDLGTLPQSQFDMMLLGAKTAHEAKLKAESDRIEAEKQAAIARAKKEAEDAAERERLRVENERLAKIAADEKKAREEAEKKAADERKKVEAKAAKEKADREAAEKARLAKEEAEKKRVADEAAKKQAAIEEQARKDREAAQKKADEERKKREALEAQIKAREKAEADEKAAKLAKEEADKAAALAAQEKALAAPEKEKLMALATSIRNLSIPILTSKAGEVLSPKLTEQVAKFALWVEAEAKKL